MGYLAINFFENYIRNNLLMYLNNRELFEKGFGDVCRHNSLKYCPLE